MVKLSTLTAFDTPTDGRSRYHTHPKFLPYPAQFISIRGMQEEKYLAVDVTKPDAPRTLEEIEISRALFEIYEGAVVSPIIQVTS